MRRRITDSWLGLERESTTSPRTAPWTLSASGVVEDAQHDSTMPLILRDLLDGQHEFLVRDGVHLVPARVEVAVEDDGVGLVGEILHNIQRLVSLVSLRSSEEGNLTRVMSAWTAAHECHDLCGYLRFAVE